jgi:hypothetical protein
MPASLYSAPFRCRIFAFRALRILRNPEAKSAHFFGWFAGRVPDSNRNKMPPQCALFVAAGGGSSNNGVQRNYCINPSERLSVRQIGRHFAPVECLRTFTLGGARSIVVARRRTTWFAMKWSDA